MYPHPTQDSPTSCTRDSANIAQEHTAAQFREGHNKPSACAHDAKRYARLLHSLECISPVTVTSIWALARLLAGPWTPATPFPDAFSRRPTCKTQFGIRTHSTRSNVDLVTVMGDKPKFFFSPFLWGRVQKSWAASAWRNSRAPMMCQGAQKNKHCKFYCRVGVKQAQHCLDLHARAKTSLMHPPHVRQTLEQWQTTAWRLLYPRKHLQMLVVTSNP